MADITILQGNDITLTVTVKDSAGSVVNITGNTAAFYISTSPTKGVIDAIITKTTPSEITITDAVNGVLTIDLSEADTNREGIFYSQLDIEDTSSNKSTVFQKSIEFTAVMN